MMKAIAATAMIVVVLSLASLPTTNGQGAASSNANSWAPADVLSWAKQLSTSLKPDTTAKLLSGLEEHGVTGKILLWIEEHDLQEDFGIESSLQRKTVLQAIGELHGQGEKMDFWEYRSMNRKQVETITGLLAASPRWAIAAMKDVPEHGQPPTMGDTPSDWIKWLIIPEWHIYSHSEKILGGLPGFLPYAVLLHLICKLAGAFAGLLNDGLRGLFKSLLQSVSGEIIGGVFFKWICMTLIWPIIPWFVSDWLFYCAVYVIPIVMVFIWGGLAIVGLLAAAAAAAN